MSCRLKTARVCIRLPITAAHGGYCCRSRKSISPTNLAKVDFWTSLRLCGFSMLLEGPWSILDETIWSLTSPRVSRISGPKNFGHHPKMTFSTLSAQSGHPANYPCRVRANSLQGHASRIVHGHAQRHAPFCRKQRCRCRDLRHRAVQNQLGEVENNG